MLSLKLCDLRTKAELCGFQGITILKTGNMTSNNKALLGGSNKNSHFDSQRAETSKQISSFTAGETKTVSIKRKKINVTQI